MKSVRPYYPPLLAAFPVLAVFLANISLIPLADLWRPLFLAIGGGAALWMLASAPFRNLERGATVAAILILAFWTYSVGSKRIPWEFQGYYPYALLVLALILAVLVARLRPATLLLNRFAAILIIGVGIQIVWHFGTARSVQIKASNTAGKVADQGLAPDIFYIILDGYGREDELKRNLAFDNHEFIRNLESMGFYVASDSHSNYCQTQISLASSLNYDLIPNLLPNEPKDTEDKEPLNKLVNQSRLASYLKEKGYATVAVLTGFPSFTFSDADVVMAGPRKSTLLEATLLEMTPISLSKGATESMFDERREVLRSAFRSLQELANPATKPRFVFAHILAPHPPFVFDKDGNPAPRKGPFGYWDGSDFRQYIGGEQDYRNGYVGQVQYINKMVLETVGKLIRNAKRPSIVILQGDHGSKLHLDQNDLAKTDIHECFANLAAFYVPDSIKAKLYPKITPVNIFRLVLSDLFGEDLPKLPDRSFYSPFGNPFRFTDVTEELEH